MKIILVGYMGSGKSAVGKRLESVLQIPFLDLDTEIEKQSAKSITQLFETKGEIYFRKKEREVLQKVLKTKTDFILATGGGTPCYGDTMEFLQETPDVLTVYLNTSVETLTERLFNERSKRPLIAHLDTREALNDFIRKHLFERNFYYQQASLKIDADQNINEVVSQIVLRLF